jgi:hypothetical protein
MMERADRLLRSLVKTQKTRGQIEALHKPRLLPELLKADTPCMMKRSRTLISKSPQPRFNMLCRYLQSSPGPLILASHRVIV